MGFQSRFVLCEPREIEVDSLGCIVGWHCHNLEEPQLILCYIKFLK